MMNQHGSINTQKYRNNSSGGFAPRYNKPTAQTYRPNYTNNHGGPPKPGGNNNNNNHTSNNNSNNNNNGNNNNNNNTGPRTGSNAIPVATKDKATITCYECGVVGHYSNECPKRNPTKEIFSELDEINAQGLIFPRSFQKTERETKWGDEAPTQQGGAARAWAARPWRVGPS
ncbi:hypothetical protein QYE76_006043 [Lolium multiflorum]|uniref:CCHC-type domain-containing protein n=1 Tax=Lolium multiflorum TaxID=4521 RepID=A0AAD8W3Q7_LOLMU|nr:hypothetical protein QYE76_006043 [Lolium multiflorum]